MTHALLDLLVRERASLWSVDALNRALYPPDAPGSTDDAIADLYAAGLVHRVGDFVFASRAAVEAERINA